MKPSILIVDDDPPTADLGAALGAAGFHVQVVADGAQARRRLRTHRPDLVVIEPGLHDGDGLELVREIRAERPTTGIVIMSRRGAEHQRLAGFEAGADDYLVKPCSPVEVVLRVAGIVRRYELHAPVRPATLRAGAIELDRAAHRVTLDGMALTLSTIQFRLLLDLMSRPGAARTHDELVHAAWGHDGLGNRQALIVQVQRLRRKLDAAGHGGHCIQTVRGIGYRFVPDGTARPTDRAQGRPVATLV